MSDEEDRFDVWIYLPNDLHDKVGSDLSARAAVDMAHDYSLRPAAKIGFITKVHIVSVADDCCVFEWVHDQGVTFPREREGAGD